VTASIVVLLTEEALSTADADRLVALHEGESLAYRVLVPADTGRPLLVDVLDHLSLFELREALEAVRGRDANPRIPAEAALAASLTTVSQAVGAPVPGEVVEGDPVAALRKLLAEEPSIQEVIIVTRPHAVEDTFHRDWASRAREALGIPVLHVYADSGGRLG
jgi:hypothetical protein